MTATSATTIPGRGAQFPDLRGRTPDGADFSTRSYYMRRNLALVVVANDATGRQWLAQAHAARAAAHDAAGEIVVIAPPGLDTGELPTLIDPDGVIAARLGLTPADVPALFVADRYRTVFANNRGAHASADLTPADIPSWLEFVSCRCS